MPVQPRASAKYIRFAIPTDLHAQLGRGEVVRSLRARSHHEAALRRHPYEYGIRCAFDIARRDPMVDRTKLNELADKLADAAVDHLHSKLSIRPNAEPSPEKAWAAALARRAGNHPSSRPPARARQRASS